MRRKQSEQPYPGELGQPMEPITYAILGGREDFDRAVTARAEMRVARMWMLARHLGIDPESEGSWYLVATRLAEQHVPGLQVRPLHHRGGAPTIWDRTRIEL